MPSEIPADIREAAMKAWRSMPETGNDHDFSSIIAQALLAEREAQKERDASLVEGISDVGRDWALTSFMGSLRRDIAAAIRQEPPK